MKTLIIDTPTPKIGSRLKFSNGREYTVLELDGNYLVYQSFQGKKKVNKNAFSFVSNGLFVYKEQDKYKVKFKCIVAPNSIQNFAGTIEQEFITTKEPKSAAKGFAMYAIKEHNSSMDIKLFNWLQKLGKIDFKILSIEKLN